MLPYGIVVLYIREDGDNSLLSRKYGIKVIINSGKNVGTATIFAKTTGLDVILLSVLIAT